jgi:hypothetical protein
MEAHHKFSPSSMERMGNCPWSYKNCQGWQQQDNADSSHGTLLHRAMYDDSVFAKLSKADRETVAALRAEHVEPYKNFEHYHELRLEIYRNDGTLLNFGTSDFVVISPDGKTASLKDWKFGNYEVTPAVNNPQLKNYVAGIFQKFPKVETVFVMTVQPAYGTGDYDQQAELKRECLPEILTELENIVEKAENANEAQAVPNAENCRYCNKAQCRAFLRKMDENFSILQINSAELADNEHEMTIEFADRLLCAEKEIKKAMEVKVALAKQLVIANGGSVNFALRDGRVTKTTNWKALCEKHGICEEEIASFTTEKQGEPFLAPRMRKKQLTNK